MYNKENKEELSMSRTQRKYDHEYKVQAVKLAREIGGAKAAKELGIPEGTIPVSYTHLDVYKRQK